jgi:hypothetical protein
MEFCIEPGLLPLIFGYDHINCNPPVLIRTPKLTQFEPAQYWGGGPPGNSAVLYPFLPFFGVVGRFVRVTSQKKVEIQIDVSSPYSALGISWIFGC